MGAAPFLDLVSLLGRECAGSVREKRGDDGD